MFFSVIYEIDKELSAIIKKVEPLDRTFESTLIKDYHGGNRAEFDQLSEQLKKKGLL